MLDQMNFENHNVNQRELSEKRIALRWGWRGEATEKEQYLSQTGLSHHNNKYHSWSQRPVLTVKLIVGFYVLFVIYNPILDTIYICLKIVLGLLFCLRPQFPVSFVGFIDLKLNVK